MLLNVATPLASVRWKPRKNFWSDVSKPGSETAEYTPSASQCQTSTTTPSSGAQLPLLTCETLKARIKGSPTLTSPVSGSERMSERSRATSTKYGPSVSSGRTTQLGTVVALATWAVAISSVKAASAVGDPSTATTVCASA